MNYYKVNTLENTTLVKKLSFTSHFRSPSICHMLITAPSHLLEITTVLAFIVTMFLCFIMVLLFTYTSPDTKFSVYYFFLLNIF